ncbi:putative secreted protein (Por secretion system target) [Lacibacter cauensis]|uniref:Putative secreted protein (Por secretion system target) n=1 Tax=Lacibacter cauensis TaxID=510947 RepID=A0A562SUM2_9BACT|nr:T9SS type A sorting domain-containing protein [Lacibacter cauensis]TWI84995.1 putative secreted protein (Por secretion system target) [Lacibacter cauensis]
MKKSISFFKGSLFAIAILSTQFLFIKKTEAQCTDNTAATSYASNNGSRGAMFNITAINTITVTGFYANLYGGTTAKYEIYYKAGTYVGSETNAAAWTLGGSVTSLYAAANNVPTDIPIPLSVTIPAGETYGFYVTNTASGGLNYTSSAATNVTLVTDANLTMTGGVGKSYPFGSTYSYRLFNGTVRYYVGALNENATLSNSNAVTPVISQNGAGSTIYGDGCTKLICKVTASGAQPITGSTTAKVWIESTQPYGYVKRHYEITPATNASTATGRVTLYFSQAEFDAYNAIHSTKLPTGPTDNSGKANLLIEKRSGTSNNNTGLPNTYTSTVVTLDPVDTDIVWDATNNRWAVSIDVNGFSGFFIKTNSTTLPVSWLQVNGHVNTENKAVLTWKVDERDVFQYVVEKSSNGIQFTKLIEVNSTGTGINNYRITDQEINNQTTFYRIKQIDLNGHTTYSSIIKLYNRQNTSISIFPNPVISSMTVSVSRTDVGSTARLLDKEGRTLQQFTITQQSFTVDMSKYAAGMYILQLSSGNIQKITKD